MCSSFSLKIVCLSSPSGHGSTASNLGLKRSARAERSPVHLWLESSTWNVQDKTSLACLARDLCSVELSVTRVVTSLSVEIYAEQLRLPKPSSRKV